MRGGGVTGITAQSSYMKKVTFIGGHRGQRELRQESLVHLTSKNPPTQQPFFSGKI